MFCAGVVTSEWIRLTCNSIKASVVMCGLFPQNYVRCSVLSFVEATHHQVCM